MPRKRTAFPPRPHPRSYGGSPDYLQSLEGEKFNDPVWRLCEQYADVVAPVRTWKISPVLHEHRACCWFSKNAGKAGVNRARQTHRRSIRINMVEVDGRLVLPADANVRHGASTYTNYGCRCDICTTKHAEKQREYYAKRRRRLQLPPPGGPRGRPAVLPSMGRRIVHEPQAEKFLELLTNAVW